jgi:RNA polymerase sigma-70 factor, ECF subfamily
LENSMSQPFDGHGPRSADGAMEIWLRSVYEQHARSLYRYALALTSSVEDAQDAVQDVFARVARSGKRFTDVRDVRAYLFSATRNASYSILRGRQRSGALHEAICVDLASACGPQTKPISATIISIRAAIDELTIEQREVIVLKILHQMTFKEIAETVGASLNTVAGRYRYGIGKLRLAINVRE